MSTNQASQLQEAEGGFRLRGRLRVAFPVHETGGKKLFVARSLVA